MTFCRMHPVVRSPSLPVIPGQAQMTTMFVARFTSHQSLTSITLRQMVVTSVRDYLRKMSEAAEKPPPSMRGSIQDSSTVSAPTEYNNHLLMLIVPRNGWLSPRWVNYFGQHNSKMKMGMNQKGCPSSMPLSIGRLNGVNNQ